MKIFMLFLVILCSTGLSARAQGTLIYDQQSNPNSTFPPFTTYFTPSGQPVSQSFVPALSVIDFIQLNIRASSPDTTIYVNLWSGSISNGVLLASTLPEAVTNAEDFSTLMYSFNGPINFFFSKPMTLTPGTTYYFQPVVEPEAGTADVEYQMLYGDAYSNGSGFSQWQGPSWDLWFAEGVVAVPEPSAGWLVLIGAISFCWIGRKRILR